MMAVATADIAKTQQRVGATATQSSLSLSRRPPSELSFLGTKTRSAPGWLLRLVSSSLLLLFLAEAARSRAALEWDDRMTLVRSESHCFSGCRGHRNQLSRPTNIGDEHIQCFLPIRSRRRRRRRSHSCSKHDKLLSSSIR